MPYDGEPRLLEDTALLRSDIFDTVKKIGFFKTENLDETNIYLLNTCHIRDKAKNKVYHEIGRVKKKFR